MNIAFVIVENLINAVYISRSAVIMEMYRSQYVCGGGGFEMLEYMCTNRYPSC